MFVGVLLWFCWVARLEAQSGPESPTEADSTTGAERSPEAPSGAQAAPKAISLDEIVSVEGGATCLNRARLIDRVARWLQRTEVTVPLRVQVRGDPELSTRVFFSVKTEPGESAERRLDNAPSDCDQLHSAVALSIALAIEATLQHPPTAGTLPEATDKPPGWQRDPPGHPVHLELAILGGASVGVLTGAAFAGSPRLGISPLSWLEISLAGFGTHLSGETVDEIPGTFESTLLAGGLDACFGGETTDGIGFFMCLGGRVGSFSSKGANFSSRNLTSNRVWWALAGSGQGRFWISRSIAIGTSVEALYTLAQRDIVVLPKPGEDADAQPVSRSLPQLGLSVTIGPVFRFF